MKFRRKRGTTTKTYKEWRDETGQYKIVWRTEIFGVSIPPKYHALVLCVRPDGLEYWCFAGARRPYGTIERAAQAADRHQKLWNKALEIANSPYKGRAKRIRELRAKALIGHGNNAHQIMASLPRWVRKSADSRALRAILPTSTLEHL